MASTNCLGSFLGPRNMKKYKLSGSCLYCFDRKLESVGINKESHFCKTRIMIHMHTCSQHILPRPPHIGLYSRACKACKNINPAGSCLYHHNRKLESVLDWKSHYCKLKLAMLRESPVIIIEIALENYTVSFLSSQL